MINVNSKKDCCGCEACYNICPQNAIQMSSDSEGFLYPKIDLKLCIDCGLCERVCPIVCKIPETKKTQRAFLVQHKNHKVLKQSTSGGAFTAIAEYVIEQGGIVFGAAFDEDFRVIHTYAETKEELGKFRNSKYVQSKIGDTFRQARKFLQSGRMVCFSGTPCQIEGLKCFLMKDYDNLITVDVVCHAVPSPLIWEKYKRFITNNEKIKSISFRDKNQYGYEYSQMALRYGNLQYCEGVETDAYLRAFFSNLSDRPSCYSCQFKKRYRVSDITIWDCFEPEKFDKKLNNNMGVTRVLIQSANGEHVFSSILQNFLYVEVLPDLLVRNVKEMFHSVPVNPERVEFFNRAIQMDDRAFFDLYFPDSYRVKAERFIRHISEKMGIYREVKKIGKKIIKRG